MSFNCTYRALLLPGCKLRLAIRADVFCCATDRVAGEKIGQLLLEIRDDALRCSIVSKGVTQAREARFAVK